MSGNANSSIWSGGATLAALAAVCTSLVALTHGVTAPRIVANEQSYLKQHLELVLVGVTYDGKPSGSIMIIQPPHDLPGDDPVPVYRVFADGRPVAALFVVKARGGFSGPVRLLIGIDSGGAITGVRVLDHRETPGLGDLIEAKKSDWILQFNGRSLSDPPAPAWAIKRDGGQFDQLTGASITPRTVIGGIKETLVFFDANSDAVFAGVQEDE